MKKFYTLFTALFFALFSFMTYAQGPWNFNGSNDIWESTGTSANLTSGASFSTLDVNSAGNPMLRTFSANINASAVTHAVITLKNNTANKYMRVFYQTTGTNRYVNVGITANDADFVSYYVDMTGNADWTGTVNELTIQFKENSSYSTALDGTIDIDNIEMTSSDLGVNMVNNSSFENWVDDTEATPVDPVGFYKHESVERSSDSHSGDYSIKVIATSTRALAQTVNEITAGATYRVSINYKIEANTGNGVRLWSTWKDASNVSLASSDLQPSGFLNTVSSEWATFSVDAVAPENATKLNFEVRSYGGATVYWDSFSVSKVAEPDPCDGVTGAPAIADDFDGNSVDILEYVGDNDATFATVDGTPFGSTSNVLQYVDNGGQYANIQLRTCNKFDMAVTNFFTMDVYIDGSSLTGAQTNKVQFKLQDKSMGGNAWQSQVVSEVLIDAVDTWQTVEFDFIAASGRTDIDQVVIQFNGENNNDQVIAYIDNLVSSTSVADTTPPVIVLEGANPQELTVGDAYVELGATATDDTDDDTTITAAIVIDATAVDTATAGSYSVTYNVSDAAGNAATEVTRTVTVEAALPPNESDSEQFCANGTDAAPTSITLTPDDLTVNNGANLLSVSVTSGTIGDPVYVGDWYDANLTVTGGVSDGVTATGLAQISDIDITGFTSITMTSVDLDAYADSVEMCLNLLVTWELPTVNDDEVVCANGTDAAPTTITLTPNDLTVNGGQQITAISITSGTIGDPVYVGDWYDANLTITGGVSDGVTATGLAQISDIDITGFTSVTMTSVDLDAYADTVEMCLNLSVTYLEPSCLDPTNLVVSDVTTTTASVNWTANNGESAWEYQVVAGGATPAETGTATSDNALSLTELTANTAYDVHVRANCGDGVTSAWVMESFTTLFQAPSCGETAEYCYANGDGGGSGFASSYTVDPLELLFTSTVDTTGDYLTLTIGGETESNYDWVYVTDGAGNVILEPVSGAMEYEVVSEDGTVNVYISADGSASCVSPSTWNGEPDTPLSFAVSCNPPPSCIDPTNLTVADITQTTASVTWTANNGESAWEYQVVESGVAPDATGTATLDNPLALTGLTANTVYDVYVRANCDVDGTSEWVTASFTTSCEVASGAWSNDFDTNDDCWLVSNGGDPNTWVLYDDSANGGGVNSYAITFGSIAHDDYLISPAFTVTDEVTDRMSFDARNQSTSFLESIDVQIWNADINVLLETVATGVTPSLAYETFTYDLSAFEGQDIRFAFYISTTDQFRMYIDNVVVDGLLLGLEDFNTSSNFTYFPNPVNNVLSIKAQASIDSITVYNMLGQTVVRSTPNTTTTAVDMSGLQTGAYFVQVAINNSIETVRVIKN